MAVLLGAQGELTSLDHFKLVAHKVVEDHVLRSLHLAGCGVCPVAEAGSFAAAKLLTRLHPAQEAPDPVHLFTVGRAEFLKTGDEFPSVFAALCSLLLDLIEEAVQFCIDLKKRIRFSNR